MTQPGDAHVPIRTCIGCRRRHPQTRLVRCVLDAAGTIRVDRHAPGRGAWLCGSQCLEPARRKRAFDRAWRTTVQPSAIDGLAAHLTDEPND